MSRSRCKICSFLRDHVFAESQWNNEVSRGDSLGELQTFLRTLGLNVSKSTISRHLVECEHLELYETKLSRVKKAIKRPFKKFNFFIKPTPKVAKCKHSRTTWFWDITSEEPKIVIKCLDCKEIIDSFDPEEREKKRRNDPRNLIIYSKLARKRRK